MLLGQREWYDLLESGLKSPEVSRKKWRIWWFGEVSEYVDRDRLSFLASESQGQSEEKAVKQSRLGDLPQIDCVLTKLYVSSIVSLANVFQHRGILGEVSDKISAYLFKLTRARPG